MAEIEIQKKRVPGAWPWILGILLLALVVWGIADYMDRDVAPIADIGTEVVVPGVVPLPGEEPGAADVPQPVQQFVSTCGAASAQGQTDMGRQHQFTVDCMQRLGDGIDAVLQRDQLQDEGVTLNLENFRSSVQQLASSDAAQAGHANLTRTAAIRAVDAIENARTRWYADRDDVQSAIAEARSAAQAIEQQTPLLEQRERVHTFFREAGELLQSIATGPRPVT